jgi:hypothetical protein
MQKKLFILLIFLITSTLNGTFQSTFNSFITLPEKSVWGVFIESASQSSTTSTSESNTKAATQNTLKKTIQNNKGKSGILQLTQQSFFCCPSMPYGVSQWKQEEINTFKCSSQQKNTVAHQQEKNAMNGSSCTVVAPSSTTESKKSQPLTVEYVNYFTNIKQFAQTIEKQLKSLVESFPNYSQGQGGNSQIFMSYCNDYVNKASITTQLEDVENAVPTAAGDVSGYFENQQFVIALDFTTLLGGQNVQSEPNNGVEQPQIHVAKSSSKQNKG